MFYGLTEQGKKVLDGAVQVIGALYDRIYAADNLITVNRSMGFFDDDRFMQAFRDNAGRLHHKSLWE